MKQIHKRLNCRTIVEQSLIYTNKKAVLLNKAQLKSSPEGNQTLILGTGNLHSIR